MWILFALITPKNSRQQKEIISDQMWILFAFIRPKNDRQQKEVMLNHRRH
jgi:hypothetical protein